MSRYNKEDSQPHVWRIGQRNTKYQEWQKEMAHLEEKTRITSIKAEKALLDGIVKATGLDLVKISRDIEQELDAEYKSLQEERASLRQQAETIVTKESREFKVALGRYINSGFDKLFDKNHHNPSLRMKLAKRWEGDANPPSGMHGGGVGFWDSTSWTSNYQFDVIEDPVFGNAVNTIHPSCTAQVGSTDRYGVARSWVTQTLVYEHAAPIDYSLLVNRIWVFCSAYGYGAANPSNGIYIPHSIMMYSGGIAELGLSVRVEQLVRVGRREDMMVHDVVTNEILAGTYAGGAISFWSPWDRPVHDFGPIRMLPYHDPYQRPIAIFNAPSGGPVNIYVQFKCTAKAELQSASAELSFHREGQNIKVHEVILQGDTTVTSE